MQYLVSQDNGGAQLLDTGRMIWMTVGLVVGAGMLVVVYPLDLLRYVLVAGAVGAAVVKRQEIKGILMTARQ
jgi:hypothetical protein